MSAYRRLLVLLFSAIAPLFGVEVFTQINLRMEREDEIRQEVSRLLDLIKAEQLGVIADIGHILFTLAETGIVQDGFANCDAMIDRLRLRYPAYLNIEVADAEGTVRCAADVRVLGVSIADLDSFRRALRADSAVVEVGEPSLRRGHINEDALVLPFRLGVRTPDGTPAGVITALLDIGWLEASLARKPLPSTAFVLLTDSSGIILARLPERPGTVGTPLAEQYRQFLSGDRRVVESTSVDGAPHVVAYAPPTAGMQTMMLAVGVDLAGAMRPVDTAAARTLATFAAVLLLSASGAAWGLRKFLSASDRAENATRKVAAVLASTTDMVVEVGRDWRATFVNEHAQRGIPGGGALLGRNIWDAFPEMVGTEAEEEYRNCIERRIATEFEHRLTNSGAWYAIRAFPSEGGMVVYARDVTARKAMEDERGRLHAELETNRRELEAKQRLLEAVLHSMPSGLFAVEAPAGRLLLHSAVTERMIGHPVTQARSVADYIRHGAIHPDGTPYRCEEYPLARALLTGEDVHQEEMLYRRGDGRIATFAVNATPVRDDAGHIIMAISSFNDISVRKAVEEALRRSEDHLNLALESAQAGTFEWDLRTGQIAWSAECYRLFGLLPGGDEPSYETWERVIHPDDLGRVLSYLQERYAVRRTDAQADYRVLHPDGTTRWIETSVRITYGADGKPSRIRGLCIDVTERKSVNEALRTSREHLRLALAAAGAGSWEWELSTGEWVWTDGQSSLRGVAPAPGSRFPRPPVTAVHPDDRERLEQAIQEAIAERRAEFSVEIRASRSGNGPRWLLTTGGIQYSGDGRPLRLVGVAIDITRRKEEEEALLRAKREAERADLAKSKFLAAASHDLRQPMQSMFLFAAGLHAHVQSERGKFALDMLERSLDTLRGLLDSLLDLSRMDANVIKPNWKDFDIGLVLEHIGASFAPVARDKGLAFDVVGTCDVAVHSDRDLLGRMVRNLVENAIKYTESGSVRLECHVVDGHARIEVRDTGIGIPPDQLEAIFDEFHQIGNPARTRTQGLGLGLSIVRRLSRILGHPVLVRSEPGSGSAFTVDVPLGRMPAVPTTPELPAPVFDGGGRLAVLIDDEPDLLLGLCEMFREWGYDTVIGSSATQALERLAADGRTPAVIVSDYCLGDEDTGLDAVRRIRDWLGRRIPAVILTGETAGRIRNETDEHAIGIAIKPVSPARLQRILRGQLGEPA